MSKNSLLLPGEKKFLLASSQKGLPPIMMRMLKNTPVGVTVTLDPKFKSNDKDDDHRPNGFYTLKGDRIHLTTSDPHILAHEMGHAESSTQAVGKIVQHRFLYPMGFLAPLAAGLSGSVVQEVKHPVVKALALSAPFLMTVPMLASEAKASINGHEILKKAGASEEDLALYKRKMLKYFSSYATIPIQTGALMLLGALNAHYSQGASHVVDGARTQVPLSGLGHL